MPSSSRAKACGRPRRVSLVAPGRRDNLRRRHATHLERNLHDLHQLPWQRLRVVLRSGEQLGLLCGGSEGQPHKVRSRLREGRRGGAPLKNTTAACSFSGASSSEARSAAWACCEKMTSAASERKSCGGAGRLRVSTRRLRGWRRGDLCSRSGGGPLRGRQSRETGSASRHLRRRAAMRPVGRGERERPASVRNAFLKAHRRTTHILPACQLRLLPDRAVGLALVVRERLEVAVVRVSVCSVAQSVSPLVGRKMRRRRRGRTVRGADQLCDVLDRVVDVVRVELRPQDAHPQRLERDEPALQTRVEPLAEGSKVLDLRAASLRSACRPRARR